MALEASRVGPRWTPWLVVGLLLLPLHAPLVASEGAEEDEVLEDEPLDLDWPTYLDEDGDVLEGALLVEAGVPIAFAGGNLTGDVLLEFGGYPVCLGGRAVPGCGLRSLLPGMGLKATSDGENVSVDLEGGEGILVDTAGIRVAFDGSGSAPTVARSDHAHEGLYLSSLGGVAPGLDGAIDLTEGAHITLTKGSGLLSIAGDGLADDVLCSVACVDASEVDFLWAAAASAGGGALNLSCAACVGLDHLAFDPLTSLVGSEAIEVALGDEAGEVLLDLAPGGVAEAHLATGAVTEDKLADFSVSSTALQHLSVVESALAPAAVTAGKIADLAVRAQHIALGAVDTLHVANGTILPEDLGFGVVRTINGVPPSAMDNFFLIAIDGNLLLIPKTLNDGLEVSLAPNVTLRGRLNARGNGMATDFLWNEAGPPLPGQVVVVELLDPNVVRLSNGTSARRVVGVVALDPGFIARNEVSGPLPPVLVASTGRHPVRVTASENDPIRPGDLLVPSNDLPGVAARCPAPDGCPGMVLGKALQSYNQTSPALIRAMLALG